MESEEFEAKLLSFLRHEGKTVTEVKGLLNPSPLDMNTALINAISSLVDKCNTAPADTQSYRKLRIFSGVKPTPSGEEEYDAWAEQTMHLLEEWQCSDNMKKQRIVESLKGPAADIVRFLRAQNPTATSCDILLHPVSKPTLETIVNPEVEQLKKDVSVMKAEMISLKAAVVSPQPDTQSSQLEFPAKAKYRRNDTPQRAGHEEDRPGIFCYRCGEDGHFKRECEGEENLKKVNKRLIKLTKKSGNYRGNQ